MIPDPKPVLEPAVLDRLASRLSSHTAKGVPRLRISSARQAGLDSRDLDLRSVDLVRPESLGGWEFVWIFTAWWVLKRKHADRLLKTEPSTRLVAFSSQAEAEAYCVG